jgi:hypothetical protein
MMENMRAYHREEERLIKHLREIHQYQGNIYFNSTWEAVEQLTAIHTQLHKK